MLVKKLDARHVHMENAQVRLGNYSDGSLALLATAEDEDGYPDENVFSLNLSAYDMHPPEGHVYIRSDAEYQGVTDALIELGLAVSKKAFTFGPYRSKADLVKLSDALLFDREEAR